MMGTTLDEAYVWDYFDATAVQEGYETLTLEPVEGTDILHEVGPVGRDSLRMQGELGRGGMAIVREARQRAIARQVAVKMAHGRGDEFSGEILRREAYVLGLLEHPNILPIYTFTEHDGEPALVLKKIVGRKWSDYISSPSLVKAGFDVEDVLEWHLQILLKVSDAIRFAHSRGIIHRDLKPSNVMIGDYGEVYLMDWGLAVSTKKSHQGILPLVSDLFDIAGTPVYMAPEMLRPEALGTSFRTDVYLLGATLYQVLCGHPPHVAESQALAYEKIERSQPEFDDEVPSALRDLCRRAMHKYPQQRYPSAKAFKTAIESFLHQRGPQTLLKRAGQLLRELKVELHSPSNRSRQYSVFGPCKFAFQEVLRSWPDNFEAQTGLQRCTKMMVEYELFSNEPASAAALLAESGSQEGPLYEQVVRALRSRRLSEDESAKLRQDADTGFRRTGRRRAMTWVGLGWLVALVFLHLFIPETSYRLQGLSHLIFLGLWLGVGWLGKEWVVATAINRSLYKTVLLGTVLGIVSNVGTYGMGIPAEEALVYHLFVFFCTSMVAVSMVDWRAWPTALAFLAAFFASARYPEFTLLAMAAANGVMVANIMSIWSCPKQQESERRASDAIRSI